ncbi:MAG: LytR/AlgR family response regulator transcription factor, partial [Bacteroidia bacterium]
MRIVIIEDEDLTAKDLEDTITSLYPEASIVGKVSSVAGGLEYFKHESGYDLIFSDIELGDGFSFEIFKNSSPKAPIIFCTAYNEYALQAFETNGIAYILKPFDKDSVKSAMNKFKMLSGFKEKDYENLIELLSKKNRIHNQSILSFKGDKIIPIKVENISMAYLENEITYLIHNGQKTSIDHTLEELEDLLGNQFFRANRQIIINRNSIKEVNQYFPRKLLIIPTINFDNRIEIGR